MRSDRDRTYVAFRGSALVADGPLPEVALEVKALHDSGDHSLVLIFDGATSEQIDLDLSGTPEAVRDRLGAASAEAVEPTHDSVSGGEQGARRGPGRPKLGVVAREVTLLPRHWEWLSAQPGGASVTLRKLVEAARRSTVDDVHARERREACFRFMNAMAGDEPGFEEAIRALFAGDGEKMDREISAWPTDVRDHVRKLAKGL